MTTPKIRTAALLLLAAAACATGGGGRSPAERYKQADERLPGESAFPEDAERQAYKDGYHLAMGFGGGSCKDYLCQGLVCQFLDSGRCRFPHRARPAMEAAGPPVHPRAARPAPGCEVRVLCKTTSERCAEVEAAIKALHTYELPAIHAVALDRVDTAYAEWIGEQTT